MAESKFAGIFQKAPATPITEQPRPPGRVEKAPPEARTVRPIGRPPGKRSDPDWKQYSLLLKRETQRQAVNILRQTDDGQDLSGLVQMLLEGWVKKHGS